MGRKPGPAPVLDLNCARPLHLIDVEHPGTVGHREAGILADLLDEGAKVWSGQVDERRSRPRRQDCETRAQSIAAVGADALHHGEPVERGDQPGYRALGESGGARQSADPDALVGCGDGVQDRECTLHGHHRGGSLID